MLTGGGRAALPRVMGQPTVVRKVLGCVCGRRLGTGSCVSVRQTTSLVVRGLGRAFLCLSVCLPEATRSGATVN